MSKHDELDSGVLYQYLKGDTQPQVVDAVHQWVAEDSRRAQTLEDLRQTLSLVQNRQRSHVSVQDGVEAAAIVHVESSIHPGAANSTAAHQNEPADPQTTNSGQKYPWSNISIGTRTKFASLIGLGACAALLIAQLPNVQNIRSTGSLESTSIQYITAPAQQATIQLVDGTVVELNVASTLTIAAANAYGTQQHRILNLSGQAAFSVRHNQSQPLVVQAVATRTTVLGTRFAIDAYTRDVRIAVETGKVSVALCRNSSDQSMCGSTTATTVLGQNDVASFASSGEILQAKNTEIEREFAFTAGRLILADSSLSSIIDQLNRWYDIDIRLGDKNIGKQVLAGTFTGGSLEALIKAMSVLLNARIEREGRVITVYSKTELLTQETL